MHVPDAIGRYPVTGVIGTGAFSAVYRAIDERLGSEVAIKLLGDHHSLDPDIRERFIAEARLLRRVQSPHVVRLYDLDETERHQPFHVLELVPGGNLAAQRRLLTGRGARVTRADVALVATAITDALTALHEQRIVHRDLTPSNLLLRRGSRSLSGAGILSAYEQVVLADLGLSKDLAVSSGLTAAGGTEGFAAPEQRETGTVDERTDVYAASALITWLVLGHPPGRADARELAGAGWPEELAVTLAAGLADDPAQRPTSIVEWRDGLLAALEPRPLVDINAPVAGGDTRPKRRWLARATVAAIVASGGAGFGVAALFDDDNNNGDATTVTELDGGRRRHTATGGGVTAMIEGPSVLVVGETTHLVAHVEGASTWTWVGLGEFVDRVEELPVTPTSTGRLTISLVAVPSVGPPVVVDALFDVVDPASG